VSEVSAPPPLRRNRDFLLLWSGQVVSTVGTRASGVAFPLLVLALTASPSQAGLVAFAQTLPFVLLFLPAGAVVDRVDRKRLLLAADGGRALAFATLAVAIAADRIWLGHVLAVAFVEGALFVFFRLAESAALPQVVPKEQLPTALAQNQARDQGATLAGAPLGGLLFGLDRLLPFLFDAISYAIGFVTLLFVRPALQEQRDAATTRLREEVAEGVRWVWHEPFIRVMIVLIAGSNYAFNALFLALIVRANELGASPALIGAMLAIAGAGALVGALVAPAVQRRIPAKAVILGSLWFWTVGAFVLVLLRDAVLLGVAFGAIATTGPAFNVVLSSYRYALVPDRLQGRVSSVILLVAWGTIPLGSITAGFLLEGIGSIETMLVLAGVMLAVAVGGTLARTVRDVRPLAELQPD
jgi:MFS family permease